MSDYIRNNFAIISAALTLFGVLISIVYVIGYVTPLDLSLLWQVEYTDIFRFFVIALSVIVGAMIFFNAVMEFASELTNNRSYNSTLIILIVAINAIWCVTASIIAGIGSDKFRVMAEITGFLWRSGVVLVVYIAVHIFNNKNGRAPSVKSMMSLAVVFVSSVYILGISNGYMTISDKTADYDIVLERDGSAYNNLFGAKLVMSTSRNMVIKLGTKLIVLKNDKINRMTASGLFR